MTYFNFIDNLGMYFKSVRLIKGYLSLDLYFSKSWSVKELNNVKDIEIIEGDTNGDEKIFSFVCKMEENLVNEVEDLVKKTIKFNKEREEKKILFNQKVNELRNLFENSKIDDLRNIKFENEEQVEFDTKEVLSDE
jgi:hypothetical protein